MKVIESFLGEILCGSVVEVGVELMDYTLKAENREQTSRES